MALSQSGKMQVEWGGFSFQFEVAHIFHGTLMTLCVFIYLIRARVKYANCYKLNRKLEKSQKFNAIPYNRYEIAKFSG